MKYCVLDGSRYPDERSRCRMCGGALIDAAAMQNLPEDVTASLSTSCCPNPTCASLVAPARVNFCALCGVKLQPISYELWLDKFVKPALKNSPADVLLDSTFLLRPILIMGLSVSQARNYLDGMLKERIGVDRSVLDGWVEETSALLKRPREQEAAEEQALQRARELNIDLPCATEVLETLIQLIAPPTDSPEKPSSMKDRSIARLTTTISSKGETRVHKFLEREGLETRKREALQSSAKSFYRNLLAGGTMSKDVIHLDAKKSASKDFRNSADYLKEVSPQGAFVLFVSSTNEGWVFPNPRVAFRPKAIVALFPSLTADQFDNFKRHIEPVPVIRVGKDRWQVKQDDESRSNDRTSDAVTLELVPDTAKSLVLFPISVDDYIAKIQSSSIVVRHDVFKNLLVGGPNGKGEFLLIPHAGVSGRTLSFLVIPRITRFQSAATLRNLYERYYRCAIPS
jgi:hypothetical protein